MEWNTIRLNPENNFLTSSVGYESYALLESLVIQLFLS